MNKMVKKLIEAAKREDWDFVDRTIPEAVKDPQVVQWAYQDGLNDEVNGNIRDLAASILEKAKIPSSDIQEVRNRLAQRLSDAHPYARFRAACALATHDTNHDYQIRIAHVLKEFQADKDVGTIAREYLQRLQ